jgi:hypothetical protein
MNRCVEVYGYLLQSQEVSPNYGAILENLMFLRGRRLLMERASARLQCLRKQTISFERYAFAAG